MYTAPNNASFSGLDAPLRRHADATPDKLAIRCGSHAITYRGLADAALRCAAGLAGLGVRRGDRVAIALPNSIDAAIAIYGTLCAGAAFVPLNPTIKADKLAAILADSGASVLVCAPSFADLVPRLLAERPALAIVVAGDGLPAGTLALADLSGPALPHAPLEVDLAAIIYTSGSTGMPKGVTLSHRNMVFASSSLATYLRMVPDDRVLSVLPLSFDYGLYQLLLCVHTGATLFLEPGVGYPGALVRLLTEERITGLPGVPTLFRVLLALPGLADHDWRGLRFITNTGAALSADTIGALRATFPDASLYSMYGLTECKRVCYLPPAEIDRKPGSVGIAIPGTEVWIEDDAGQRVAPGTVGQLMVRGPHVMQGYWNDTVATAARLRPGQWPWERTLCTGDLFRQDEEGFLYFVGRRDEIIKSRGEKISPREVEDVLLAAPGVLHAAVVGVEHDVLGQAVWAHVAPTPGFALDPADIHRHCQSRLESHLVPFRIVVHEELPKTPNGKIDKRALLVSRQEMRT